MARLLSSGVAVLLLAICGATTAAQSNTTLTGKVWDQNGAVVVHADVKVLSLGSGLILKSNTNLSGQYEISGLRAGAYQVSVSSEGFSVSARSILLRQEGRYVEDFVLVPGAIESSITVTAGKGNARIAVDTPQIVTTVGQKQIEELRPASTLQALERAPNLTPVAPNALLERPRLRGLTSNRVLIILDGDRLNNVRSDLTSGVSPSVMDVTQLQSAEVLSGAGSNLYGSDAMSGVINLVTPSLVQTERTHLGLRFNGDLRSNGRFRRGAVLLNWSDSKFAIRLSGSLFRQGNYHTGDGSVSLEEVFRLGTLATDMSNAIGNSVGRTYAVWNLPAGSEIANGQAHGFNDQVDVWFFPKDTQSVRYRQLNSQHRNLGFSFIATPFDPRTQFNSFRRLDKYGLRYEGREIARRLPRIAVSAYAQKYSFPDDTITSTIVQGSSFTFVPDPNAPQNLLAILTGNRSTFIKANLSENKNSITTLAFDGQATFAPSARTLITTGIGFLRESSADEFSRIDFTPPFKVITERASNPDVTYRNWSWFNLLEYQPSTWLRLSGGLRVDKWNTEAKVTRGFPLGVESTLLDLSFANLVANPGPINTEGAAGIIDLIRGLRPLKTNRTVVTGNAGIVIRLPHGINPYFRWGSSFREPGVTERYLLRDFGDPTFSVLVIPNTTIKPERGNNYDIGVKVQRASWNVQAGYFRNLLSDFVGPAFAPPLFVPADPTRGLDPISPFFPFHGVLYVQRTNTARARIQGIETTYEASLPLGQVGNITTFGTLGWLKGSNLSPDQNTLRLIAQFYDRSDTPVPLRGSANDAPLSSITPLRMINGIRFDSRERRWFGEYQVRYQARVRRADPLDLSATISTQYGTLASLNSFSVQSLRGGYVYQKENHRVLFTVGIENLTNRFYFEHFYTAPAAGRSVVIGTTIEFFNLLRK